MSKPFNIAILGAGVMGLSAAYALSRAGHKITIFDPAGFPADNASFMAGGMLAPYAEIEHMPYVWIKAGLHGIQNWQKIMPDQVVCNGSLLITHDEDRYVLDRFKTHLPQGAAQDIGTNELESQLAERFPSAIYIQNEAHLNPHPVMQLMVNTLREKGVILKTEKPSSLSAYDRVIDCRGMSAAADDPDLRGVKGEILIVENREFSLSRPVRLMHPRYPLYIVPRADHIFMIGATSIESAGDHVTLRSGLELMSALYSLHPSFAQARIVSLKAGVRPAYPDNLPRIRVDGNVIRCNGLFRHGFLLAPVMAECVVDYIDGKENEFSHLFLGVNYNENNNQRSEKNIHRAA